MKTDSIHERLEILSAVLQWEGRLNNARLRELFGLSQIRASQWIREFRTHFPHWTIWDTVLRSFNVTPEAYRSSGNLEVRRQNDAVSLSKYLALVGLPHSLNSTAPDQLLWAAFPDLSVPSPRIFASISESIRTHSALDITYRSMREPAPHQRTIIPHSLVRAGRRWHVRAFSTTHKDFRDYAMGRIENARVTTQEEKVDSANDVAWNTMVPVRLVAHPQLTPEQQSLIRFEYFHGTSARVDTCRGALISYFIQDVRAATDPEKQKPPDYQLAVENIKEIAPWLFQT